MLYLPGRNEQPSVKDNFCTNPRIDAACQLNRKYYLLFQGNQSTSSVLFKGYVITINVHRTR